MKMLLPLLALSAMLFVSCGQGKRASTADERFQALTANFLEAYLPLHPEDATVLGDHRFDHLLNDWSAAGQAKILALDKAYLDTLKGIKVEDLSSANRVDYDILERNLRFEIFSIEVLKGLENNPMTYNVGGAVFSLIARDFAPLAERMKSLSGRLALVPQYCRTAKANLAIPPAIHTQTAIRQNDGNISLLESTLQPFLDSLPPAARDEIVPLRDAAVVALKEFGAWMKSDLLVRSSGDFRLGTELYDGKLAFLLDSDMSREQIHARAMDELRMTTDALYAKSLELAPRLLPGLHGAARSAKDTLALIRAVLDRLAADRPDNATIVERAKEDLREATAFVREKNLLTMPEAPVDIIVMPEFQRGVAVAYCDSPGPLEKNGKTIFAISPTPADWPASRVSSFFREYNNYMLKNLTVHEAVPGHYVQLMKGNEFQAPTLLRGVFPSGIFAEGWATYAEQVMADAGFGGAETAMQQLKMRLRLIINAIIDQKIHTAGMTQKEAMDLMITRGFQEEGEAAGKWTRACLTSGQLSTYFVGNILFNDLRQRSEQNAGTGFSLKEYHDKVLSFGTISPKYLPALLGLPVNSSRAANPSETH